MYCTRPSPTAPQQMLRSRRALCFATSCVVSLLFLSGEAEGFLSASGTCLPAAALQRRAWSCHGLSKLRMLRGPQAGADDPREQDLREAVPGGMWNGRRNFLALVAAASSFATPCVASAEPCRTAACDTLVIPLQACGGSYCLQYLIDNRGCAVRVCLHAVAYCPFRTSSYERKTSPFTDSCSLAQALSRCIGHRLAFPDYCR